MSKYIYMCVYLLASLLKTIVDDCTLCDMCYETKCPYTPPHPFNLDFPALMLRYRAIENRKKNEQVKEEFQNVTSQENDKYRCTGAYKSVKHSENVTRKLELKPTSLVQEEIVKLDKYAKIASIKPLTPIVNW